MGERRFTCYNCGAGLDSEYDEEIREECADQEED